MANKFARHAKAAFIQDFAILYNHGVAERATKGKAGILHRFASRIWQKVRADKITDKAAIAMKIVEALTTDRRIFKIDFCLDFEAV